MATPFHDALIRRLGIIQNIGTDATEQFTSRMAAQRAKQAALQARQQAVTGLTGSQARGGTGSSGGTSSGARWEDFGLELQRRGFKVGEHPDPRFGGRVGQHSQGSRHYSGNAFDVNWASGTSAAEQQKLREAVELAKQYGIPQTIFMAPGHYGHAHFGW
jgi:hypothetical protein